MSSNHALAEKVEKFWHDLGYRQVRCWAEKKPVNLPDMTIIKKHADGSEERIFYPARTVISLEMCSNLINGLPPRHTVAMAA